MIAALLVTAMLLPGLPVAVQSQPASEPAANIAQSEPASDPSQDRPAGPIQTAAGSPLALLVTDSELVRGPSTARFRLEEFVREQNGLLSNYYEQVGGEVLSGAAIVDRVSHQYSVGPERC